MLRYRAESDATVTFTTGGGLPARGDQVEVPHHEPRDHTRQPTRR